MGAAKKIVEPVSDAVQLIRLGQRHVGRAHRLSHLSVDHADGGLLRYAIRYGVRFFVDDVKTLAKWSAPLSGERTVRSSEKDYAVACGEERGLENMSFALSYEAARDRKPFLVRDPGEKTPKRMYVGRQFTWLVDGTRVQLVCTSFNDERGRFAAVDYDPRRRGAPKKRLSITHEDVKKWHKHLDGDS